MKKRVADIIAEILTEHAITDVFSVVGGGAMFLNDAFGHHDGLRVMYNHHEQASAVAAEGYVRATGNMAAVCVTTGPGGTNALTGVMGAYVDNYPMIVISGQVRYETSIPNTGLTLRTCGEQEFSIVDAAKTMTKYAKMVIDPMEIRYELEKAIHIANTGRRGPCWIDVPLNVQGAIVEENDMKSYVPEEKNSKWNPELFINTLNAAKRPVLLIGSGFRSANAIDKLLKFVKKLRIPVLAATYNADLLSWDNEFYFGNFGVNGGRAGNFIVQNADLIIGMGCRMTYRHIGFNYEAFAPTAKKMIVDVDENELKKPTLKIDIPINEDIHTVMDALLSSSYEGYNDTAQWLPYCSRLKNKFPIYIDKFNTSEQVNPYFFIKKLHETQAKDNVIVLGNSSIAGHVLQMGIDIQGQRIINNMNSGSMGYDLPATIGAARALGREVTMITGDGSLQMNLQELETVVHYNLPIKMFVCNNGGYRAIVRTQKNFFEGRYTGCSPETGVGMPDMEKIAYAYGIPFMRISSHKEVESVLKDFYALDGFAMCEVMQDYEQMIEPRIMSKKLADGTLVSPVLDDLFPFLSDEDVKDSQYIEK